MTWVHLILSFITFSLLLRYYLFPLLFARLTQFRVSSFSILAARGLEYRSRAFPNAVVPTLRVERIHWLWGGLKSDEVGLLILKIEGVSFRVKKGIKQTEQSKPKSAGISSWKGRITSSALHLFIHHYPSLARIISIQISDVRIIFDDLDGLELGVKNLHLGVKVTFEGDEPGDATPKIAPTSPAEEYRRANPLLSPMNEFSPPNSPPISPAVQFRSFGFDGKPDATTEQECNHISSTRLSRMAHARRRASKLQSKMTSTAGQVWSRAIARAHGSVSFSLSIDDVALILPVPADTSKTETESLPQDSIRSLGKRPRSFASVGSFHSLLHPRFTRTTSVIPTEGYDRLVSLNGVSKAVLGLGFGPKKGLLGEDTLRTEVHLAKLSTTLESVEKLQELVKRNKDKLAPPRDEDQSKQRWLPRSMPRIIMRAFESVALSLDQVTVSHRLPTSDSSPVSANSSYTDLTDMATLDDAFNLSLDLAHVSCKLNAADSSTDLRARNAFGTNTSPESQVRGFAFALGWDTIGLQCIAPGEKKHEMTQLVQMRSAQFDGLSTWRPNGWCREELLFASDPNLALLVGNGSIDSIDVAGDVQLLDELSQSWKRHRPKHPSQAPATRKPSPIPPRVRIVLDIGHAMVQLADRVSEHQTTLTLASDGLHLGCFTNFTDIVARRRDRSVNRSAFKREEELRQRREEAGEAADYAQPAEMLRPELRRHFSTAGSLNDDYSLGMKAEASVVLEPISLHMSLSKPTSKNQETYHLASIGRAHGTISANVQGRQIVQEDGTELTTLDPESTSCLLDLGIDSGVKLNLWNMPVIDALSAMAKAHRPATDSSQPKSQALLCRLPSGVSARVSLGLVSVFIGHQDPNPDCNMKLSRGLWIQTTVLWEYAYYSRRAHCPLNRHSQISLNRAKLRLPEDITTQALAFENSLSAQDGRAALVSFTLTEIFVKPIYDGQRFSASGGTSLSHGPVKQPNVRTTEEEYVGWEFRRNAEHERPQSADFANNVEPFEMKGTDQASRPMARIKRVCVNWGVVRMTADAPVVHKVTSKIDNVELVCDLSHVYCVLLVVLALRKIAKAYKPSSSRHKERPDIRLEVTCPSIKMHFAFPLREQLYIYVDNVAISKSAGGPHMTAKKVLAFVPSPRVIGSWEELGRIKALAVQAAAPGQPRSFNINAVAFRVRIPVTYKLSKLILNINVTIKALKLLVTNFEEGTARTVKKPVSEDPKRLPAIRLNIDHLSLEAKDDPIETNLNLIWRAGMAEQEKRNELEDLFEAKVHLIEETRRAIQGHDDIEPTQAFGKLTAKLTTSYEDARNRLDWFHSRRWVRRSRLAKQEQRRRQQTASKHLDDAGWSNVSLPIRVVPPTYTVPLFRLALSGVDIGVQDLGWSRDEIIQYMGDVSTPFDQGVEFSLMVPIKLSWSMAGGLATLRDYPLPLVRIPAVPEGDKPAWQLETPFIISEELQGDDSLMMIPVTIVPEGCGDYNASDLTVQIAKTIMPVKTYTRPVININTPRTTEFTWGNSYQPAIQDFTKVIETLSHPPRDPSPRVGFWDKFKLVLHWKVTVNFVGNVHLHLKGSLDPYAVVGHGAGFAFSWKGGTKLEIAQPNDQHETIQICSSELLIAIPDLTALHDDAAMGNERTVPDESSTEKDGHLPSEQALIERRYTKPCARFLNGVRVGFGFVFERTCREWNCAENCGKEKLLARRQCRIFNFKRHQEVILRSPEAIEREAKGLGRTPDSYEGFRSDFIHFSVSVVAPLNKTSGKSTNDSDVQNSLHFSPKATTHFGAWWATFSGIHLPIRQGALFPGQPPPSIKFGKSIGTIKYRCDLAPVYLSHVYVQTSKETWQAGKSQSIGLKARVDRIRADAHQRQTEIKRTDSYTLHVEAEERAKKAEEQARREQGIEQGTTQPGTAVQGADQRPMMMEQGSTKPETISTTGSESTGAEMPQTDSLKSETTAAEKKKPKKRTPAYHKVFYAADVLLNGIQVKGICANFVETTPKSGEADGSHFALVSELSQDKKDWFNFFDFIDADKKPFDRNPELEVIDVMDCPQVFVSRRIKAKPIVTETSAEEVDDDKTLAEENRLEVSKFGHEKSHICYLGAARGVAETQMRITEGRIAELEERRRLFSGDPLHDERQILSRIRTLKQHLNHLALQEHRHFDDDTFQTDRHPAETGLGGQGEQTFEWTAHAHCPRVYYNNLTRNIIFKYWYSYRDRKKEKYMTSHSSLRGVRDGIQRRMGRTSNGYNQDDIPDDAFPLRDNAAADLLHSLQQMLGKKAVSELFQLPTADGKQLEDPRPHLGLPEGCTVKSKTHILVLKPQLALRSGVGEGSVILLAVEEVSYKEFSILDDSAGDNIAANVLSRHYAAGKGLQAFYPTADALRRERDTPGHRGLDFIPLEIFLDVRSEATDYDRIVLKTDAEISLDRFNHLRMPRGLEWPDAKDERGQEIKHLRLHQDLARVVVPRLQVSATSKHYNALYNVVTDLLIYQDPGHRERADRIDNFTFAFDRKDRDPQRLLMDLHNLQHSIRSLDLIKRGYEANVDLLTEEGRNQLFDIRTDQLEAMEQLFTVFEAISVNKARDEARAALKSASRIDVRVGGIAWHMLRDDLAPLLKLDIEGTLFSLLSNKDGSIDNAFAIGEMSALNSDSDALYPEVLVRYESGAKKKARESFASACWSILAPVGGIDIVRHFAFYVHPVRFRLEEKVGHQVMDYIFSDRVERRKRKAETKNEKPKAVKENTLGMTLADGSKSTAMLRTASGLEMPQLSRSKSQLSVNSSQTGIIEEMGHKSDDKFTMVPTKDASEMRRRASAVKTFVGIVFGATSLVLSYKSDESRKKHGSWTSSVPDCVDFKLKTPQMTYSNKVWGYEDVFEHVKRDIKAYAWSQTGDLLGQLFKKTSMFRSKKGLRHLAMNSSTGFPPATKSPSNLRFAVQPPTPLEEDASHSLALARAITKERETTPTSPISRSRSRSTVLSAETPQILGVPLTNDPSPMSPNTSTEEDEEHDDEEGRGIVGKRMKGILGKIKKHTSKFDLPHSLSSDELVRGSSERSRSRVNIEARAMSPPPHSMG